MVNSYKVAINIYRIPMKNKYMHDPELYVQRCHNGHKQNNIEHAKYK